jgi:glycosyltransferase involved in cell wall biosynthesis
MSGHRVVIGLSAGTLGGVDVFSATLARELNARGVSAHVLLTRPFLKWNPMPVPPDVPRHELPGDRHQTWGSRWWTLIRYLEGQAPCVYVPNYDYEFSCVSPRLPRDVHVVGIVHSDDPVHYEHVARLGPYWDAIVAVSPAVAESVRRAQPRLDGRLVTIPYGVPLPDAPVERPLAEGRPLRVVYAGRLDQPQKRVLDLPVIFQQLLSLGVPAELTIVGDGPSRADLIAAGESLLARGVLRLLGTLPNSAVLELFEQSDAVILTSTFEGLPVCLLEAMGRGCVPVVTDVRSGIPDLVEDGVNGFRVPVGDTARFAQRLALLQQDGARRRALSDQARRTVRDGGYDSGRMADRYLDLFDRVREEARRGHYKRPRGRILCPPNLEDHTWKDHLPLRLRSVGAWALRALRRRAPGAVPVPR